METVIAIIIMLGLATSSISHEIPLETDDNHSFQEQKTN